MNARPPRAPHRSFRLPVPLIAAVALIIAATALGQQEADLEFQPRLGPPAYPTDQGPRVAIDAAHHNFHTATGRYQPAAQLLRRDGCRVEGLATPLTADRLRAIDVLVIANPLHARNRSDWSLPTPSAFTADEVAALRAWVEAGGSLLLIADHMPFPGAAGELAAAFGFTFSNGYAGRGREPGGHLRFTAGSGLATSAVTRGRSAAETVSAVVTFTGSAFTSPAAAQPVLVLPADAVSLEPRKAWEFSRDTTTTPVGGWHQGATLAVGRGRVAVFGEAAMFTAQRSGSRRQPMGFNHPDAPQNAQLLLNVIHWLARTPGMPE